MNDVISLPSGGHFACRRLTRDYHVALTLPSQIDSDRFRINHALRDYCWMGSGKCQTFDTERPMFVTISQVRARSRFILAILATESSGPETAT